MRERSDLDPTFSNSFAAEDLRSNLNLATALKAGYKGLKRDAFLGSTFRKGFEIGGVLSQGGADSVVHHI